MPPKLVQVQRALWRFARLMTFLQLGTVALISIWFLVGADLVWGFSTVQLGRFQILFGTMMLALAGVTVWHRESVRISGFQTACQIERVFPHLGERLLTVVTAPEAGQGNNPILANLRQEVNDVLATVNLQQIFPYKKIYRASALFGLLSATLFAYLTLLPYGVRFSQRMTSSWIGTEMLAELGPLPPVILRSESVTVRPRVTATWQEDLPNEVKVRVDAGVDAADIFSVPIDENGQGELHLPKVQRDFGVDLILNGNVVAQGKVLVREPIHLLPASTISVRKPAYFAAPPAEIDLSQTREINVPQYSIVRAVGWLNRPCVKARMEIGDQEIECVVGTGDENDRVRAEWIAEKLGPIEPTLHVEDQFGFAFAMKLPRLHVRSDHAPTVDRALELAGKTVRKAGLYQYTCHAGDILSVRSLVKDVECLDSVHFEMNMNDRPATSVVSISLHGKTHAEILQTFPTTADLKVGDRWRVRMAVKDGRSLAVGSVRAPDVPSQPLMPQVVFEPPSESAEPRWLEVLVVSATDYDRVTEMRQDHEDFRREVERIRVNVLREKARVEKVRKALHERPAMTSDDQRGFAEAAQMNSEAQRDLFELARRWVAEALFAPLAEEAAAIAEQELAASASALRRLKDGKTPSLDAAKETQEIEQALLKATVKLSALSRKSQALANAREQQWDVTRLAEKQRELAEKLEKLLAGNAAPDPATRDEIEAEQARIGKEVAQAREEIAAGTAKDQNDEAGRLAEKMDELRATTPDGKPMPEALEKLEAELLKLAQGAESPKLKDLAKEMANDLKKQKDSKASDREKPGEGMDKLLEDGALKLSLMAGKKSDDAEAKESLRMLESAKKDIDDAEKDLKKSPVLALPRMKMAAKTLAKASKSMPSSSTKAGKKLPNHPSNTASGGQGGGTVSTKVADRPWESFAGGLLQENGQDLKTRLQPGTAVQMREEFAPLIQRYFRRLAETPAMPGTEK